MSAEYGTRDKGSNSQIGGDKPRSLTGYHMFAMVAAFFAVIMAANFTLVWFATSSWTGLVVKNSYVASQQYNGKIAAAKKQKARGWQLKFEYSDAVLLFSLSDSNGEPVFIENFSAVIGRPVSQNGDVEVRLSHKGQGRYQADIELSQGIWGFQLNGDGEEPYHIEGRFFVSEKGTGTMQ